MIELDVCEWIGVSEIQSPEIWLRRENETFCGFQRVSLLCLTWLPTNRFIKSLWQHSNDVDSKNICSTHTERDWYRGRKRQTLMRARTKCFYHGSVVELVRMYCAPVVLSIRCQCTIVCVRFVCVCECMCLRENFIRQCLRFKHKAR